MLKPRKIYFLLIILLTVLISCKEDTIQPELFGTIDGTVLDAEDGTHIGGASVSTAPATTSLITDSEGKFNYPNVNTGSYTITVTKIDYEKKSVTVSVKEDQTTPVIIQLEKSPPVVTDPPAKTTDPSPENEALNQLRHLNLSWSAPLTDAGATVIIKYDVYLYDSDSPIPLLLAKDLIDTTIAAEDLSYGKTYFWQVDSKIQDTLLTQGDVWSFSVRDQPDYRWFYSSNRLGNYEIFTSDYSETDIIRLTERPFKDWWPRLNPNRRSIAFSSDEETVHHIYKMNRDGSGIYRVTSLPIAGFHNNGIGFSWSPDGGKFLYSHYNQLYQIDENGANLTLITTAPPNRHFRECEWSPFSDKIVVLTIGEKAYENEIYLMDADGSNMNLFVPDLPGIVESPSFSVDGRSCVYTHDVSGFEVAEGRQLDAKIFVKNISDSSVTEVSINKPAGTNDTNPRFSPDGSKIIFTNAPNDGFTPKDVWEMDVDGENRVKLFTNAEHPDWH